MGESLTALDQVLLLLQVAAVSFNGNVEALGDNESLLFLLILIGVELRERFLAINAHSQL